MGKDQYSITLDDEKRLVRVVASGDIVREVGNEIITKALATAAEHHYHIFCDVRQATVKVTLADWFFLPRTLAIFKNKEVRSISTAIVIAPGKQEDDYRFYETVVYNLGMELKVFKNEKDALDWLATLK